MPPMLQNILRHHMLLSPTSHEGLLFCDSEGKPLSSTRVSKDEFKKALRRAGLKDIRLHDLRHSFASCLIAAGENIKWIQGQLGHSSIQVTMDRYGHLISDVNYGSGARLEALIYCENQEAISTS